VADPHNATRGFFFAHMGWLLIKKHPAIVEAGKKLNFDDLANDSTVSFQKKLGVLLFLFECSCCHSPLCYFCRLSQKEILRKVQNLFIFYLFTLYPIHITKGATLMFSAKEPNICYLPVSFPHTDPWFALFMCFVFPGLVCTLWGDNFWNGYWVAGGLRYILVLHATW
jgi:fatty-acid desaturase